MRRSWLLAVRGQVPRKAAILFGLVPIILLVGLWWFLTAGANDQRRMPSTILPSPREVLQSLWTLLQPSQEQAASDSWLSHLPQLLYHIGISLQRVALGYLLALAIVLPLGIFMGSYSSIRAMLAPMTTASGYIPIAALVPVTMSWFGIGEWQKVAFLAMAFGIYLLPVVINAIDGVPDVYLRTSYTLGATRWQVVWRVLIPVALPAIWQGMRLAFGVGWTYLVLAEVVVKDKGLGDLIDTGRRRGLAGQVWLSIIIITLIAWVADLAWERLGRLIFPYRRGRA